MTDDPSLDPIFDYLREHSDRYSFTALRDQLLQNGYEPAAVDRAIAIYQQENPPTFSARELVWPKVLLVLVANILLVLSGVSMQWLISLFVVACGEILGGIALLFLPEGRAWGRALLFGFLLTAALALLLFGICVSLFSRAQW